ncbi:MAG: AmmeMemoRadiSam system protein B, partial [Candidatus Omnitrophota bacterium]|nr:AmmeMemoRadiSam system protein B [Candidatus Omnitrophota bacterium]
MKKPLMQLLILAMLIFLFSCFNSSFGETRKPAVSGAFYSSDKEALERDIKSYLENVEESPVDGKVLAIIVPHAGYAYSGQVAAHGFKHLEGRKVRTVVLMCNSHTAHFRGAAIDEASAWETPLGTVKLDKSLAKKLVKSDERIQFNGEVHKKDHSLEVEIPFLQTVLKGDFKIVPILFGNMQDYTYKTMAELLYKNLGKDDIIVVSTDMSHYPRYEDSAIIDPKTAEYIEKGDVLGLEAHIVDIVGKKVSGEQTLCCGLDGIRTVMEYSNLVERAKFKFLKYANSGDAIIGDRARVVGYVSMVLYASRNMEKEETNVMKDEYLTKGEKQKLLEIAKASVVEAVTGKRQFSPLVTEPTLKQKSGAFVTIKKHGQLRGCIGYIIAVKPLHETVKEVARSAAINDHRFNPVSEDELETIEVEVSALTPLRRIKTVDEIEVGKHGLYMKRGLNSGLLLPQVATEYGWNKETFLEHTSLKARLPKDAWKDSSTEI